MRPVTFVALLFLCTLIVVLPGTAQRSPEPDGRLLVTVKLEGDSARVLSTAIVEGVLPPPAMAGDTEYRLIDADGRHLATGLIALPRTIIHCKAAEDGSLSGMAEPVCEPVVIMLPWYREAARLQLRPLRSALPTSIDLAGVPTRFIEPAALDEPSAPADFRGYFAHLPPAPAPLSESASRRLISPSAGAIQGSVDIAGVPANINWSATIYLLNGQSGAFIGTAYASKSSKNFTFNVGAGTYMLRCWLWIFEPAVGNAAVPLHPFPATMAAFPVGAAGANPQFTFTWYPLVKGTVRRGGSAIPSQVFIFDPAKKIPVLDDVLIADLAAAEGTFAIHMPGGAYPFVTVPRNSDQAADQLAIITIPTEGTNDLQINLNAVGNISGAALKQIWPAGGNPVDPAAVDPGKFNLLFMAEAYTAANESFTDANGNGVWDGDLLLDENGNGVRDNEEYFYDRDRDRVYDPAEAFKDNNGDRICNRFERAKFELRAAINTAAMLNFQPYKGNAGRMRVYTWWTPSTHAMHKFTQSTPWKNMQTYFGVTCNGTGGFQSGGVDSGKVASTASSVLPGYTVATVLLHDPMNATRSNAMYNFGRILQAANDLRGGATFIHEAGHSFFSMGDEYVYSEGTHYQGGEPAEINLTTQSNPALVKWKKFIKGTPPVPTPYGYDGFGLVAGGAYGSTGIYRPTGESMMRSTDRPFTKMQQAHMKKILKQFTK